MSQQQIADHLMISRVSVNRMLKAGREMGIVMIQVLSPNRLEYSKLEQKLEKLYFLSWSANKNAFTALLPYFLFFPDFCFSKMERAFCLRGGENEAEKKLPSCGYRKRAARCCAG